MRQISHRLSLFASVAIVCVFAVQHVELAETWAWARSNSSMNSSFSTRFSSFSSAIKTRIDTFNVDKFRQQIRSRVGEVVSKAFEVFTKAYNRSYTPEELIDRLNLFVDRYNMVQAWNRDFQAHKSSFSMKLNHLADRSENELNKMNGLQTPKDFNETLSAQRLRSAPRSMLMSAQVPSSKDWRTSSCLPPIRNQKSCGCCYAFATVDMVGTNYCLETGGSSNSLRSAQQVVDCGSRDLEYGIHMNGCNGGWPEHNIKYLQKKQYLASETSYPYRESQGTCRLNTGLPVSKSGSPGPKYVELYSEKDFKNHIGVYGPVVAAIHASNSFQMYNAGLYDGSGCAYRQWNHAVLVVGYGRTNGKDYWLVKNSYGTDWGENGYMRMERGKSLCKMGKMGWGLIPSSSPSKNNDFNGLKTTTTTTAKPWRYYYYYTYT